MLSLSSGKAGVAIPIMGQPGEKIARCSVQPGAHEATLAMKQGPQTSRIADRWGGSPHGSERGCGAAARVLPSRPARGAERRSRIAFHAGRRHAIYVRLVHPQPHPGQAAEDARRWQAILAPQAQAIPGVRAAYFLGDGAAETVHAIVLFDAKPGEALDQAMDDFRQRCRDITTGPARREDLEVLAEA